MHKLKMILAASVCLAGLAATAQAADFEPVPEQFEAAAPGAWYLRADVGWSFLEWSGGADDDDITFGGGVGYRYNENWRADVRVDFSGEYDIGGGTDLGFGTALVNGYFDLPISSHIAPYLGAGVGYGWTYRSPGPDDDGFAYALMAGVGFEMTQQITLDVGYRYRQVLIPGADVKDHSLLAGVRFEF